MPKDGAWRVSAFGSWLHPQQSLFSLPSSVIMERRQELGASHHSSTFDASLRAEPDWHSTTSLPSSSYHMEPFSFIKADDRPPSVQWPSGKG